MLLADLCQHAAMFESAGSLIFVFAACSAVVVAWLFAARWSLRGKLPARFDQPVTVSPSARSCPVRDSDRLAAVAALFLTMAIPVLVVWAAVASGNFSEQLRAERVAVFVTAAGFAAPVVIAFVYLRRNMVG